jgi:hypothetical protein
MNITYIVGNGLDLQYGLKTRYKDFYEFQNKVYISRKENEEEYSNFIYESLFSDKVNDYENWSDFELSIGKLTKDNDLISSSIEMKEKFIDDFSEVVDDLREYLRLQQEQNLEEGIVIDFVSTLNDLKKSLPVLNQSTIDKKFKENLYQHDIVNILTLNYTNVLDRLYDRSGKSFVNKLRTNDYNFYIKSPIHAHGTVDICTVLGVSDETQISNNFEEEQKESLIKNLVLRNYRENMDVKNTDVIKNSDIIILYGVSLGKTDKYIWSQIAEQSIRSSVPVIIYYYIPNFDPGNPTRVRRLYKMVEDKFIHNSGINLELEKKLRDNLIVVIGKTIFDLIER